MTAYQILFTLGFISWLGHTWWIFKCQIGESQRPGNIFFAIEMVLFSAGSILYVMALIK